MIISWDKFTSEIWERLKQGAEDYEDKSFSRHPIELIKEAKEELADVLGWAFILWHRLGHMEAHLAALEEAGQAVQCQCTKLTGESQVDCSICGGEGMHKL